MKLRKPCPHGWYDGHEVVRGDVGHLAPCPGGVFLPDDLETIILKTIRDFDEVNYMGPGAADALAKSILDALSVQETE